MITRQRSMWLLLSGCASLLPALALLFLLRAPLQPHAAIILDGRADSGYGPALASDPDDLNSTIEGWIGTGWTEVISLYVTNDTRNLYVLVPLPAYSHTQSSGSYGLVIATGQYTATGGAAPTDPWGNAITFAYTATHANVGQAPTPLPYRIIPDFILRGNIVGHDCCGMYDNGWSELRRWNGSNYTTGGGVNWGGLSGGTMVSERLAFADGQGLEFAIPLADLGMAATPGTPLHLQFFATQTGSTKGAYDTVPSDDQSAGWDDPTVQRFLATYVLVTAQDVRILSPAEGTHFLSTPITVTGVVSPSAAVTVTLSVNGTHLYTPTLDGAGYFTQAVPLDPGVNTITATAVSSAGVGMDVRHVTYGPASADGDIWWGCLGHFTRDETYRQPWGTIPAAVTVTLRLRACRDDLTGAVLHVYLHNQGEVATLTMTRVLSDTAYDYWEAVATAPLTPTLMYYKFEAIDGADHDWYVDDAAYDGRNGWGHAVDDNPIYDAFRITVYDPAFQTPAWLQNGVVYQIFPDRFRDGDPGNNVVSGTHVFYDNPHGGITYPAWNTQVIDPRNPPSPFHNRWSEDFYGGDLQGVTQRLDDLQGLGVTVLYLNPIFLSPSNHRYDTASYEQVDPALGGDAALAALLTAAHARGMHVILDGVFNHTSSDSLYFDRYSHYPTLGAYESQSSPYFSWYRFNHWPDDYEMWWIYDTLPRLQSDQADVRTYIYSGTNPIATRWLLFGADGWRLDVGGDIDGGAVTLSDGRSDYWEGFRSRVKAAAPQAVIIGEEWGDATYWLLGQEWDSVMNYRFRSALLSFLRDTPYTDNDNNPGSASGPLNPITVSQFDDWLHAIQEDYPPAAWYAMLNLAGSHDTNRVRFVLGHAQHADGSDLTPAELDARQGLLALLQFTLPGAPTVYYGDEVGLESPGRWYNSTWEDDPYNRAPYPWADTPGYYQARPGVRAVYAQLGRIRGAHPALRTGSFDTLLADDAHGVYAFGRRLEGTETAVVVVNRSGTTQTVSVPLSGYLADGTRLSDLLNRARVIVSGGAATVTVRPEWGAILTTTPEYWCHLPLVRRR